MSFDLAWNLLKASRYVEEQGNPGHPIPFNTVINRMIAENGGDPQKASTELKNKISHRGQALQKLKHKLRILYDK